MFHADVNTHPFAGVIYEYATAKFTRNNIDMASAIGIFALCSSIFN